MADRAHSDAKIHVLTMVDRVVGGGGGESVAAGIAVALDADRFARTLCVTRPSAGEQLDRIRAAGVRVVELGRRGRLDVGSWRRLARFLREHPVDVFHSHKFGSNVWAATLKPLLPVSILVTHEHSWAFSGDRVRLLLDRHVVARAANAMVAVSDADARRMVEIVRVPASKVVLIPNGVDVALPHDPAKLRRDLGLSERTAVVGFVGSLRPEKRVDLIVDAFARVRASSDEAHLVLVGAGPEEPELRRRVERHGIADAVTFAGFRTDATDLAAAFDVAVLASDREGVPLSLLEYMALGRAIVATAVGGIPTVARDGEHAVLVPPGDAEALAGAVARLIGDPAARVRLGAAAKARQEADYSFSATMRRIEALYDELISERSARSAAERTGGRRCGARR
jgi:glycosyltransferase involved in cell wall biosynthesis